MSSPMGTGLPPIRIASPTAAPVTLRQPAPPTATVVPIGGAVSGVRSFLAEVTQPQTLVQVAHGMTFQPAGITVNDSAGDPVEYESVSYPAGGIVEITFAWPFVGTIRLS